MRIITVGTRASALAIRQTEAFISSFSSRRSAVVLRTRRYSTLGDRQPNRPIERFSGRGIFTTDIEEALLLGEIDVAVHSLKDLPADETPGLTVAAIPTRADVRDTLVSRHGETVDRLPIGAIVGTSSKSRTVQLRAIRPDLEVRPIRGNVDTRVDKVSSGEYDAAVLAAAGLQRLGLANAIADWFSVDELTPSPGQGALAVQCRSNDHELIDLLASIDRIDHRRTTTAERAFHLALGGDGAPVAALAEVTPDGDSIFLRGSVVSPDGISVVRVKGTGSEPLCLGRRLAGLALERTKHHPQIDRGRSTAA